MEADAAAQIGSDPGGSGLQVDKFIEGPITCLRLQGTINESFDGKRLASQIRARTLILDLGGIRKISSFGIREWTDFIKAVARGVDRIVAIECTPKVVDQLNMVSDFLGGKGQVFSFYAPYRCDYCDVDRRVLFQVDRDQAAIRGMRPPEQLCETCSRPEYFDEEPGSYFAYLAAQQPFSLEPDIAEFLSSKLSYSLSGADRRLQVDKHIEGRNTYLKFVGNLDGSFPSSKIAEGLEGTIVVDVSGVGTIDLAGAAEWRNFITMTKGSAELVFLVGCPPILLERLTRQGDLGDLVISFTMPYSCSKCATTASQLIDVEEHYDILKFATPPEMKCAHCKSPTVCVAPEGLLSRLRTLPRVQIAQPLKKFIKEMRDRKPEKVQQLKRAAAPAAGPRVGMLTAAVVMAVLAIGGVGGWIWYSNREQQKKVEAALSDVKTTNQADTKTLRPSWITSDTPSSAVCTDSVSRLACIGVSSFNKSRDAGEKEAAEAALDELASSIALKIPDPVFAAKVRQTFEDARAKALKAVDARRSAPTSEAYKKAVAAARASRQATAEALQATGGAAVPAQRADWWWEEYDAEQGGGSEFLVFVRYDVSTDALRSLVGEYSTAIDVDGSKVMTVFPSLAWKVPAVRRGGQVVSAGGLLEKAGVGEGAIVTELDGAPVKTASDLAAKLQGKTPDKLGIIGADGTATTVPLK
jgi:anti-anti-sigma regulatory factor